MADELWRKSASKLAQMIRERDVSSREVVQAHLERIEAVNAKINAVTIALADTALTAADHADANAPSGPLHGVPFSVKENIDCLGSATTHGLAQFTAAMPTADSPVVARMKRAGAIPLARTNLPELGLRIATDNPFRGRTNNPWAADRTAGGSSGGEAAALATGMTPLGFGNDLGGSLRNPAYCCGITSLKPTTGRIPWALSLPPNDQPISYRLMVAEGPMARSVADLKLVLPLLAGREPRDPMSVTVPLEGPAPAAKNIALVTEIPGVSLPTATVAAVRRAGDILTASGWSSVETQAPELELVHELWGHLLARDIEQMIPRLAPLMSAAPGRLLHGIVERFPATAMSHVELHTERDRMCKAWSAFFEQHPLVIGPIWTDLPFVHDADLDLDHGAETTLDRLRFITPGNLLGIPAIPVPMGESDGLPTGVQIYADRWREDLCLQAAAELEAAVAPVCPIDPRW